MRTIWTRTGWFVVLGCWLAACTITQHVQPVPAGTLSSLCIKENSETWSKEFLPTLRAQLAQRGIATSVYNGTPPPDCRFRLEYDVNWGWDLAVYLTYADLRVYDGDKLIGEATYDARGGDGRMDKFGHTEAKLNPLIDQMLSGNPSWKPSGGS